MNGDQRQIPQIENDLPISFTGGINNVDTPLGLFIKQQGDVVNTVNADTTYLSKLKIMYPLAKLNSTPAETAIHSIFRALDKILIGYDIYLQYLSSSYVLTSLLDGLSGDEISMAHIGSWVFAANGTDNKSVYLTTPEGCDWGLQIPTTAPTVVAGDAGLPTGTYSCYYRYKVTLPDGSILRSELSPVGSITTGGLFKIEWSGLIHSTFAGATTVAIELFRTKTGFAAIYLVDEVADGITTYSDNVSDTVLQTNSEFIEEGYYPPPDNVDIVYYHEGADRLFAAIDNDVYWSEGGEYHNFIYDISVGEYTNVNSVFLPGENVTAMIMIDEQMYFGSEGTWRRLRGVDPTQWNWESTNASKGPINWRTVCRTPWGAMYPGNDGYMYLFNGFVTKRIIEHFKLDTIPTSTSHSIFDGRFYKLWYGSTVYPKLVIDLIDFPNSKGKVIRGTESANSSFYHNLSNILYIGTSDGYVKSGEDTNASVTLTLRIFDIPVAQLKYFSDFKTLYLQVNTHENDLTITPYYDDVAQDPIIESTNSMEFIAVPLDVGTYRKISFEFSVTTSAGVELEEPWFLSKETNV